MRSIRLPRLLILGVTLAAAAGLPAAAQAPTGGGAQVPAGAAFPATPPEPGPPRDFTVPAPKRFTLDNGLEVALVQWGTIPKADITLTVRAGNGLEGPEEVWLADLTADLMREGTASRSAAELSQQAASMGGSLDVSVGADLATIGGEVLSEFAPQMIDLVADVARHPTLPESELPRLKANMERQLALGKSQPQQLALEKFLAVLYKDHPYGRLFPTEAMIKGYTLDQARRFYQAHYGAGRSRLYIVGRFDAAATEAAVRKAFGDWEKGAPVEAAPPRPSSARAVYLIDRPGAPQSTVILGLPVANPSSADWIPLQVMNALLGGSFGSRITRNIREDKGYTYSPYSQLSTRYRDTYWAENADVTTADTGPSIKEILGEIDRLQQTPPSAEELRGIQNYMAGTYVRQNSSRGGITGQLIFMDLHGLPPDYASQYVKRIYAVTPEKITEVARDQIQDDRATIVVVGDSKVVASQLEGFGQTVQ
jgi:predicted Zn-dependent peptidase